MAKNVAFPFFLLMRAQDSAVSWVLRKMHPQYWAMYPVAKASPDNLILIPTA